ncbi:MAG: DUF4296 domain-containing protein [Ginsengibacter sp.]
MKIAVVLVMGCLLVSCSGKKKIPEGIIGLNQMTKIMWNVLQAQALATEMARRDSLINVVAETKALTQKALGVNKTSAIEYDKSYNWYVKHPDVMQIIFDSLYNQKQRRDDIKPGQDYEPLKKDSLLQKNPVQ